MILYSVATAIADDFEKKKRNYNRNKIAKIMTIFVKIDEADNLGIIAQIGQVF